MGLRSSPLAYTILPSSAGGLGLFQSWLCNTPLYLQLQWFDTVENVDVSVKLKRRRWTSEITARDALYLEKLGVILS